MDYYFIGDGTILESGYYTDNDELRRAAQDLADDLQCAVYVLKGEHTGIEAQPSDPRDLMTTDEIDQATEDTRAYMGELDKLARWNRMATGA